MSVVKPTREAGGGGPRRRDRGGTRSRMLDAARQLFLERGYAATTIPEIAAAAGVAVPTIYWAFGSKRAIVREIREEWLRSARTQANLQRVLGTTDPRARLDAYAAFMGHQWATGAEVLTIQQDAQRADPEVATEIAAVLADRTARLALVVRPLRPALRHGLTVRTAHDILLALSMLEVYRELRTRGWTDARYQAWLGRALREQLLAEPSTG